MKIIQKDFTEFNNTERNYYSQDFSPVNTLMKRIRSAFTNNVSAKTADLNFDGIWNFDQKNSFIYITLFQAGEKPIRYGSIRKSIEETVNRCIEKIKDHKRFKNFDIKNHDKCRILLEFVIDKQLTDLKYLNSNNFDEHRFEPGITGLELKNVFTKDLIFYMPTDAIIKSQMSLNQALETMINKTPIGKMATDDCEKIKLLAKSNEYELYKFRSRAFITYKRTTLPIYRGNILYKDFDYDILLTQFIKASDWLVKNMYDDGRFLYYYDCTEDNFKDHEHPKRKEDNLYYNDLRHCGGAITLLKTFLQTQNNKYLIAAKKAIDFIVSISQPHDYNGETAYFVYYNKKGKLGGTALALIMMMQYRIITGDKRYDTYIKGYVRHLISRICASGEFMGYYIHPAYNNGEPLIKMTDKERKETFSFYYPGEALFGLGLFMNNFKDDINLNNEVRTKSEIALDWIVNERPKIYADMFTALPSDAWLMQAIDEFAKDSNFRKDDYINFVYTDAQSMMDRMYAKDDSPYIDYEGAFYYNYGDHYYPDGARSEGLISAYYLAKQMRNKNFAKKILHACKLAAKNQFSLFNCKEYTFAHKNPQRSENSIRFKATRQWVRVDSIQHVACFFIRLYWAENPLT